MIITFISDPKLVGDIYDKLCMGCVILNLSSLYSGYRNITPLITKLAPINNTGMNMPNFVDSVNFDMQYAEAILNTPELFCCFMEILRPAYEGEVTCVLVQRDPYRDAVMESIIKLIQQRYGINCWIIESKEDIDLVRLQFGTANGLLTLDQDIHRYQEYAQQGLCYSDDLNVNIEY